MSSLSGPFMDLVTALKKFPGIGQKSAVRLAFMLVLEKPEIAASLRRALEGVATLKPCQLCGFVTSGDLCSICEDPERDNTLCVVEKPQDLMAIERTKRYHGKYFILGALLSPAEGMSVDRLPIARFKEVTRTVKPREIIFALSPTLEGELTIGAIKEALGRTSIPMSRIASGVPVGVELEYTDEMTLSRALEGRTHIG